MRKIVLSTLAALAVSATTLSATEFYVDDKGQVFTTAAEGRKVLESKETSVFAHADKLKFSGLTYLGYTFNDHKDGLMSDNATSYKDDTSQFEIRRAYLQLKAYLLEDTKSYYRITLDLKQDSDVDGGSMVARAKYAYLYLDNVLPATGVEIGLAHRPWHDYEEHNAWMYRDISKVLIEDKNGGDLSNSADFGINFKTKTKYFDSEIGIFNGEGYHAAQATPAGMSLEWRATAHLLGENGKDKQTTKTYLDLSFFGQYNQEHKANTSAPSGFDDLVFMGLHTVYNQPEFLISAQYVSSTDTADNNTYVSAQAGSGYSANGEVRFGAKNEYRALARYDSWTKTNIVSTNEKENTSYIIGAAWQQNKNVQWVANAIVTANEDGSSRENENGTAYMLTAQVEF